MSRYRAALGIDRLADSPWALGICNRRAACWRRKAKNASEKSFKEPHRGGLMGLEVKDKLQVELVVTKDISFLCCLASVHLLIYTYGEPTISDVLFMNRRCLPEIGRAHV